MYLAFRTIVARQVEFALVYRLDFMGALLKCPYCGLERDARRKCVGDGYVGSLFKVDGDLVDRETFAANANRKLGSAKSDFQINATVKLLVQCQTQILSPFINCSKVIIKPHMQTKMDSNFFGL